ncbi:hypothetical protein D3C73_1295030 [compost metagenome]
MAADCALAGNYSFNLSGFGLLLFQLRGIPRELQRIHRRHLAVKLNEPFRIECHSDSLHRIEAHMIAAGRAYLQILFQFLAVLNRTAFTAFAHEPFGNLPFRAFAFRRSAAPLQTF